MADLAAFLLARIAEDEADVDVAGTFGPPADWGDVPLQRMDYDQMLIGPRRVLAECEAKRRIVELYRRADEASGSASFTYEDGRWTLAEEILPLLALPYADHPDYREEWRP